MLYCIWHEHTHISKAKRCYIVYDMTHTHSKCVILYMTWAHTHSKGNRCYIVYDMNTHIPKVKGVILYMTWAHTHSKGNRCYIVYDMNTHTFKR